MLTLKQGNDRVIITKLIIYGIEINLNIKIWLIMQWFHCHPNCGVKVCGAKDYMTDFLKNTGLKSTVQRRRILEALNNSVNKHVSAEDLYKLLKSNAEEVSLATIYRVLAQFEMIGIVTKHNFEDNFSVFELSQQDHHDHLICNKCGKIIEFVDDTIENRQIEIASQNHFKITGHSLRINGICNQCR